MKHNFYFFIAIFIVVNSCNAMEISLTKNEKYATFLDNNSILIHGKDSCRITDIKSQKTLRTINDLLPDSEIEIHPAKKYFALFKEDEVQIYNLKTGQTISNFSFENKHYIADCYFSPFQDILFLWRSGGAWHKLNHYNYITQKCLSSKISTNTYPCMDVHPTENYFCLNHQAKAIKYDMYRTHIDQSDSLNVFDYTTLIEKNYTIANQLYRPEDIRKIKYSSDGSLIASANNSLVYVINLDKNTGQNIKLFPNNEKICALQFHPHNSVLAVITHDHEDYLKLNYVDITNQNIIAQNVVGDCYFFSKIPHARDVRSMLSFSPDGTHILIRLNYRCIIYPVPFDVIYQPKNRGIKFLLLYYCLFNHYRLPKEIFPCLIEAFKR